jgi:PemK-like, MazF-like toxin of type II toxin-antitoxin system
LADAYAVADDAFREGWEFPGMSDYDDYEKHRPWNGPCLAFYPFASGAGGKRRPGLVVQNDADNTRMAATILAQITTNLARAGEPTHLLIQAWEWSR